MELKRIQEKMSEIHRNPSVRSFEAVALSPFLYIRAIGYFAGSIAVEAVKPAVQRLRDRVEEIDNSDLGKSNSRQRKGFTPDPDGVEDFPYYPPPKTDEHMLTASESEIPLGHEQQGEVL
jgi:hypothetical protein